MANRCRTIWRVLAMLAVLGVGGCFASEPPFETAVYSAVGAQVK